MVSFSRYGPSPLAIRFALLVDSEQAWTRWVIRTMGDCQVTPELALWAARAVARWGLPGRALESAVQLTRRLHESRTDPCPHCTLAAAVVVAARSHRRSLPPPPACPYPRRRYVAAIGQAVAGEGA